MRTRGSSERPRRTLARDGAAGGGRPNACTRARFHLLRRALHRAGRGAEAGIEDRVIAAAQATRFAALFITQDLDEAARIAHQFVRSMRRARAICRPPCRLGKAMPRPQLRSPLKDTGLFSGCGRAPPTSGQEPRARRPRSFIPALRDETWRYKARYSAAR